MLVYQSRNAAKWGRVQPLAFGIAAEPRSLTAALDGARADAPAPIRPDTLDLRVPAVGETAPAGVAPPR